MSIRQYKIVAMCQNRGFIQKFITYTFFDYLKEKFLNPKNQKQKDEIEKLIQKLLKHTEVINILKQKINTRKTWNQIFNIYNGQPSEKNLTQRQQKTIRKKLQTHITEYEKEKETRYINAAITFLVNQKVGVGNGKEQRTIFNQNGKLKNNINLNTQKLISQLKNIKNKLEKYQIQGDEDKPVIKEAKTALENKIKALELIQSNQKDPKPISSKRMTKRPTQEPEKRRQKHKKSRQRPSSNNRGSKKPTQKKTNKVPIKHEQKTDQKIIGSKYNGCDWDTCKWLLVTAIFGLLSAYFYLDPHNIFVEQSNNDCGCQQIPPT